MYRHALQPPGCEICTAQGMQANLGQTLNPRVGPRPGSPARLPCSAMQT
jgi:hypothetical protein